MGLSFAPSVRMRASARATRAWASADGLDDRAARRSESTTVEGGSSALQVRPRTRRRGGRRTRRREVSPGGRPSARSSLVRTLVGAVLPLAVLLRPLLPLARRGVAQPLGGAPRQGQAKQQPERQDERALMASSPAASSRAARVVDLLRVRSVRGEPRVGPVRGRRLGGPAGPLEDAAHLALQQRRVRR